MATTTTNFGWDIPQSTDLVKDGATAIAALGQDIDTALVDLKGGTTGQVLAKASGTDLDFSWVAQDDSNAIQNAIVDAKGDLIGATAADTPARLAVGTNGTVLTADSAEATGLKWAAPQAGALVLLNTTSFSAVASQSINDVFSTTYDNYKFIINTTGTAPIHLRFRVSGSDNSTANSYISQVLYAGSTTIDAARITSDKANIGDTNSTFKNTISGEIFDPFLTVPTRIQTYNNWSLNNSYWQSFFDYHNQSTSYTGFTIYPGSGTITGSVSVYGYSK